ncbi:MAG: hypothetical protein ABSB89_05120 [Candidatus Bathyarchaeia archaeon]|jgi:hypothetical protein
MPPKKIVYLFGAGATIAETQYAGVQEKPSLEYISETVIRKAKEEGELAEALSEIEPDDITDIELYISLLESARTKKYLELAGKLRSLFSKSIQDALKMEGNIIEPMLTNALLQMHGTIREEERFAGAISLNYDNLLDRAFNGVFGGVNYGIDCRCKKAGYSIRKRGPALLKLHGSFNWSRGFPSVEIDEEQAQLGEEESMLWIPPGIEKDKDAYPFNILWGKAFEMLDCDVLRIVGCKLKQNDWGLLSLIFNTQLETDQTYEIQLIDFHREGELIRQRNGFLRNVKILGELENCQDLVDPPPSNPFESWLRLKLASLREKGVRIDELGLDHINALLGATN